MTRRELFWAFAKACMRSPVVMAEWDGTAESYYGIIQRIMEEERVRQEGRP